MSIDIKRTGFKNKYYLGENTSVIIEGIRCLNTYPIFLEINVHENRYRNELEKRIVNILPSAFVLRNDAKNIQGIPDIIVLCGKLWAMLEIKISEDAPTQANQPYYIDLFSNMSFAAFIYPENEDWVLEQLVLFFESEGWDK